MPTNLFKTYDLAKPPINFKPLVHRSIVKNKHLVLYYGMVQTIFKPRSDLLVNYAPLKPYVNITLFDGLRQPDSVSLTEISDINDAGFMLIVSEQPPSKEKAGNFLYPVQNRYVYVVPLYINDVRGGKIRHYGHQPKIIPPTNYVEFDRANFRARVWGKHTGPSGYGHWCQLRQADTIGETDPLSLRKDRISKTIGQSSAKNKRVLLEEGEVLFFETAQGSYLAIKSDFPDLFRAGFIGKTGSGKTTAAHFLESAFAYLTDIAFVNANDTNDELKVWIRELDFNYDRVWVRKLLEYGYCPRQTPVVLLYPTYKELNDNDIYLEGQVGFPMSINANDFYNNWDNIFGQKKEWKMERPSRNKMMELKDELKYCENMDHVAQIIRNHKPKIQKSMADAMYNRINDIYSENLLDCQPWNNRKVPSLWKIKHPKLGILYYNPILACILCGLYPTLVTKKFSQKSSFSEVIAYYFDTVIDAFKNDELFYNYYGTFDEKGSGRKKLFFVIDEFQDVIESGKAAIHLADITSRKGRQIGIGVWWLVQIPKNVSDWVWKNTDILFIFQQQSKEDAKDIVKGFPTIPKGMQDDIVTLRKHECVVACKQQGLLVEIRSDGSRHEIEEACQFKGKFLPPLSSHKRPSDV